MTSDIKPTQNTNVLHYLCKKCYKQYQLSVLLMKKKNRNETKGGRFTADKALCCHSGTIYRKSSIKPPEG